MCIYFGNVRFHFGNDFFRFVCVEFQDASHLDLHQSQYIFFCYLTDELRIERCQPVIDVLACGIHIFGLFKLLVFVDTLFNEYLFKGGEMQAFL